MPHGEKHNVFILSLKSKKLKDVDYDFAGGGTEADVLGSHAVLGVKGRLFKVKSTVQAMAGSKTAAIHVYYGASKSDTAVLSATMDLTSAALKKSGAILDEGILYEEDSEFCLSENSTASSNVVGLGVDLYFRSYEGQ